MNESIEEQGTVAVTSAARAQAPIIQNLMQLYIHDFSEFWGGTSRGELNMDGRFDAYPLHEYWSTRNWLALLIWCGRMMAGFSLVNDQTHSGLAANRNMAEFFILRKYRARGVSQAAAKLIFSQQPGLWEVAVARKNARAQQFWRKTLLHSDKISNLQEFDRRDEQWNGPIFRFDWGI